MKSESQLKAEIERLQRSVDKQALELDSKNRELEVEAALERVRAQTMAMHSSEDVGKCVVKMFSELTAMGVDAGTRFGIGILNHDNENNQLWTARKNGEEVNMHIGNIDMASHPLLKSARKAWKEQLRLHKYVLEGQDLLNYYQMLNNAPDYKIQIPIEKLPKKEIQHCFIFEHGFFYAFSPREFQPKLIHITKRFSSLFEQTYRRYLDLVRAETQAREAEIELALERVRARTMAMHHTEELKEVIQVVFDQFVGLKIHVEHAGFILDYKEREDMHIWLADHQQGVPTEISIPYFDSPHWNSYREAKAKQESFFANLLPFEVKNKFYQDLFELIPELTEEAQQAIFSKPALAISTVLLDNVGLYIEHYSMTPYTAEENKILMRFGKVFQQTYTRFLDLQKVEAQAREAQIEAALERVRNRSLGMQTTKEMQLVANEIREQLLSLGLQIDALAMIGVIDNEAYYDVWVGGAFSEKPLRILYNKDTKVQRDYNKVIKERPEIFTKTYSGKIMKAYLKHLMASNTFNPELEKLMLECNAFTTTLTHMKNSSLQIIRYKPHPFSDSDNTIVIRFGKVFEQAYIRFLDLQKAEAQAREAQIEAALERVRSRSMAMHKSEELAEVSLILFEQVEKLGIKTWSTGFNVWLEDDTSYIDWVVNSASGKFLEPYKVDLTAHPSFMEISSAKKQGCDFFVHETEGETLEELYRLLSQMAKTQVEDIVKAGFQLPEHQINHYVFGSKVSLMFITFDPCPEAHDIFKRFGKVFEQTYTRFLDLQRAEAQARESQIQLALERVRARTMAMQHSDELMETSELMFEQIKNLGIELWSCGFSLWYDDDSYFLGYNPGPHGKLGNPLKIPLTEDIFFTTIREAKRRGDEFLVFESEGESLVETYRYMDGLPVVGETMRGFVEAGFPLPTFQVTHCGFFSNGHLMFITQEPNSEAVDIFKRFTKVFNQTNTRFLDLQKAEAQGREALIEAALEKVRSRSLAMHNSEELNEVATELFQQIRQLGGNLWTCGIVLCQKDSEVDHFMVALENGMAPTIEIPHTNDPSTKNMYYNWKNGADYYVEEAGGKDLKKHYDYLETLPTMKPVIENLKASGISLPTWQKWHAAYFTHGYLMIITLEPYPQEEVFKRFAKVFEQTYTRFLDLKKAEAQAREAQIEAGLERVRSKSLAMHKTAELQSVIHTVHQELLNLNISISGGSFIVINSEIDYEIHCWGSGGTAETSDEVHIPRFEKPFYTHLLERIKSGPGFFTEEYTREEKIEFFTFLFQHEPWSKLGAKEKKETLSAPGGYTRSCAVSKHTSIFIINHFGEKFSESENAILIRFGKVFEQTYTRFLDLQKAEAQAKEAQIELSLERIRSQVTAMQESSDLLDIVVTMRTEFVKLGHEAHYFWHMRWLPERYDKAMTSGDGTKIGMVMTLPRHIHGDIPLIADWEKTKEPTVVLAMEVETAVDYVHKMITLGDFEQVDPQAPTLDDIRHIGGLTFVMARTTHGEIGYSLPGVVTDPPKNAVDTLIRFAGVFDLAYKRFEDLKSAERQHREAQIELALERVRARTMAMQKSDELADAAFVLFEQLRALGGNLWGTGFGLCQENVEKDEFWFANENGVFPPVAIPNTTDPAHKQMYRGWQKKTDFLSIEKSGAALKSHYDYMLSLPEVRLFFQKIIDEGLPFPEKQQWNAAYFSKGYLLIITLEPYPEPEIFKRFAKVFEQTYTRFLDLQKAEAQTREAKIEAALEKVRSRSLAVHKVGEFSEVVSLVFEKLGELDIPAYSVTIPVFKENSKDWEVFGCGESESGPVTLQFIQPYFNHPLMDDIIDTHDKLGIGYFSKTYSKEEKDSYYEFGFKHTELKNLPDDIKKRVWQSKAYTVSFAFAKHSMICVNDFNGDTLTEHQVSILKKFSRVFEQAYIRFLDLQKAESQAREAEIQLALERVRARSLAMHRSEELADISMELVKQVQTLGMESWFCAFNIYDDDPRGSVEWGSNGKGTFPQYRTPREGVFLRYFEAGQRGETLLVNEIGEEACPAHYEYLCSLPGVGEQLLQMKAAGIPFPTSQIDHVAFFKYGYVLFITYEPAHESHDIFKRFANVFEQSYTRFLDLQKAEAQTREAKIEGALEKVRSRTMGMQSSEELPEVANLLFTEVRALGIHAWSCGYNILAEDKKTATCFMSSEGTLQTPFQLRLWGEASFDEMGEFVLSDHTMLVQELGGAALEEHYARMKSFPDLKPTFDEIDKLGLSLPTYQINHLCKFTQGFILFITYEKVPESHAIFKRFTNVFDQTYTRFLDLKKAEAQAREAQIENALEKVRSRSLAMQSPDELIEVAQLLREEMGALGVEELETSSIYIHDNDSNTTQCWFTIKNSENPGKSVTDQMTLELQDTWVGRKMLDFYRSPSNQTSILMQGEQRIEWIRYCEEKSDLFGTSNFYGDTVPDRTYHLYKFSNGYIGAAAPGEISTESWELLKRATAVFSFAYTRFRDLQMAEASARAAMRQASLDRVRAEISSMRHVNDLERITPLFFQELTTLGIPFIRCGVFIIQEKQEIVEAYLSSPDGNSLGVLRLPYQASELTFQTVEAWRKGAIYRQHWNKEDFIQWISQLMEQDQIQDSSTYQGAAAPPESLDLHFVPFTQGMLYVGAVSPLGEKELELVQALAKAFSIAYARYEDFVKLEQAKAEVESAMSELKATQSQLVQQEKLASLGQLTAGIAHEIKNPLNFVNNFSEVSIEMIEEVLEARSERRDLRQSSGTEKGGEKHDESEEMEDEILEDIKGNLKKIHEHGSRANGIVTSMLQHSRGGSGNMEPTDLNALIKEYVNLSFHGMRAGKNPINVDIILDLDPDLGMVSMIKEDFTRVVINLCNNAFDAMRGKKYEVPSTKYQEGVHSEVKYLPKLKVTTMLENGRVRLLLEDNGPGIPDEIKDKILQPFFTTKKGTEGTGLGLSITHDIVKAHGGDLQVSSTMGERTEMSIILPLDPR